jgi:uncharacterized protein YbbC (DUF1343 family)
MNLKNITFGIVLFLLAWSAGMAQSTNDQATTAQSALQLGAARFGEYLPVLGNRKVGLVVNQTTVLEGGGHLVDTLLGRGVRITAIYAPEHGYRGNVERGKSFATTRDSATGITVYATYGSRKKPAKEDLKDVEVMVFDMQDVGARFFTYISTLHYIMEACAENNLPLVVLDRPNPLGYYVDGPVLDPKFKSFIGMHPIPTVHGMTIGEYARMINGEKWLANGVQCNLTVVPVAGYHHKDYYAVPVRPSPNLPDMKSVYLYPTVCLFEGTNVSEGRGTEKPFQQFGAPYFKGGNGAFTPRSIPVLSLKPKYEGQPCRGYDLSGTPMEELQAIRQLELRYLLEFYRQAPDKTKFFEKSFDLLAGSDVLRKQIIAGRSEAEIRRSWQPGLEAFKQVRKKYLLYEE